MDNQVEDIKRKLDIVNVISKYMPLKKRGRHFMACCPFHGEKTPSFMVSPELQIFKCFGCGKGGDIFTFVEEYEKVDFREALEELAKMAGITLIQTAAISATDSIKKRLIEINTLSANFYNYVLLSHPLGKPALDYILDRGVTLDTIKQFKIGFSPQRNDSLSKLLLKKNYTPKELLATGTFGQSNYGGRLYDRFQGRLVFPLYDYRDRVVGFSGRILPFADNQNSAKYINSPETEIYHKGQMVYGLNLAKEAIKRQNSVLVVEGEFDMISPFQLGVKNIVALKGTAFTENQLQLLKRYTTNLILALDSDFAGNNAAKKSIELAENIGMEIQVLTLGNEYKDPDEAVQKNPDYFLSQLKETIPIWDFLINSAVKNYGVDSIIGKKQILSAVMPFITKIENAVIRADYYRKLASELGTTEAALFEESDRYTSHATPQLSASAGVFASASIKQWAAINDSQDKSEKSLLVLIFGSQQPLAVASKIKDNLEYVTLPKYKNILNHLLMLSEFDPQEFAATLPPELQPVFQDIYLEATALAVESSKRFKEIQKSVNRLIDSYLKTKGKQLSTELAQAQERGDDKEIERLENEINLNNQKKAKLLLT